MSTNYCQQCRTLKTQITHYQGRVIALARRLSSPNARNPEKLLADVNEAKAGLASAKVMSEQHEAEHVED